jgi:hypothetical protein
MNILDRANKVVNERMEENERQYGPFAESIERASRLYELMTGKEMKPENLYFVMIALKLSREAYAHKEDNLLDAVAYIGALNNYINEKNLTE